MSNTLDRIDWLDVISTSDERRDGLQPRLYAADTGGQTCYGVRLGEQWLVGRNAAVMFDTTAAARNFLRMIGIKTPLPGDGTPAIDPKLDTSCRTSHQCFHISSSGGLGVCPRKRSPQWQLVHGTESLASEAA